MARIHISNNPSGAIIVSLLYDPLLVEKVKTIDGRRWHSAEKHWSFPPPPYPAYRGGRESLPALPTGSQAVGRAGGEEVGIAFPSGRQGAVPDLRTDNHPILHLENGGEGGFESELPPKYTSLRK